MTRKPGFRVRFRAMTYLNVLKMTPVLTIISKYPNQLDPMPWRGGEDPDAVLLGRVRVREVRTGDGPDGVGDLVLAAALLAVVVVLVKHEP